MKPLHLLIKPASSLCNLRCGYCFYHDVSSYRAVPSYGLMSEDTQELLVQRVFAEADGPVTLAFQGGEPTMAGLPFYQRLIELVSHYNVKKWPVQYALQTNAQVIDESWAAFLARHHFLVGVSLDGDKAIHDAQRLTPDGRGSFQTVMNALRQLEARQVETNILTVVHAGVARHIERIYRFFSRNQLGYLQFIPCLTPFGVDPAAVPYALTAKRYGQFLNRLFDLWYEDFMAGHYVSIRHFDNWVRMMAGEWPELCGMTGRCTCQLVVEADGSVYPCDFYVTDEWKLGDISTSTLTELAESETSHRFVEASLQLPDTCRECQWLPLCRGGCRRDRAETAGPAGPAGLNQFCEAYQMFFPYAASRLEQLALIYRRQKGAGHV